LNKFFHRYLSFLNFTAHVTSIFTFQQPKEKMRKSVRVLSSPVVAQRVRSYSAVNATLPKFVRIVEVGLRDGLQNEKSLVPLQTKLTLLNKLYAAGLRTIEAGAFVSPKWVPQMKDTPEMFSFLKENEKKYPEANFTALTPNTKGFILNLLSFILLYYSSSCFVIHFLHFLSLLLFNAVGPISFCFLFLLPFVRV
jgi:hypothetical protein